MTGPRVLLMSLSVRTSAKGREFLSGYLGKARIVGFEGEPDKYGNPTWTSSSPSPSLATARNPPGGRKSARRRRHGRVRLQALAPVPRASIARISPSRSSQGSAGSSAMLELDRLAAVARGPHSRHY